MRKIVFICLLLLSVNAVLIQTIVSENDIMKNALRVSILLFAAFLILIKKQPLSVMLLLLINLSAISLIIGQNTDQLSFIFIFFFIQSLFIVKTRNIEKYLLVSSIISLGLVFVFLRLGLTINEFMEHRGRYTFGMKSVAFFYNIVYGTCALLVIYSLKYFKRGKWFVIISSLAVSTYFFLQTDLRGGYLSFLAFLILLVIVPWFSKLMIFRYVIGWIPVLSLGAAFYIASLNNEIAANELLSYRPFFLHSFLENINFTDILLSTSVKAYDGISVVDNSYLHLLAGGGIVMTLAVAFMFYRAILNLFKHKKHIEIAFIVATCMYFNTESIMVRAENMFVIYFWYLVIKYSLTKIEPETEEVKETIPKRRLFKRYKIVW